MNSKTVNGQLFITVQIGTSIGKAVAGFSVKYTQEACQIRVMHLPMFAWNVIQKPIHGNTTVYALFS